MLLLFLVAAFQVRSKEMHHKAEFGLAAHWTYKGSGSATSSLGWMTGHADKHKSTPDTDKVRWC